MSKNKEIIVYAAETQEMLANNGAVVVDTHCQTITEAKKRAKWLLTVESMDAAESTTMLNYSQVVVGGEVLYDYFGKASA